MRIGASYLGEERCRFRVWAPDHERVWLVLAGRPDRVLPMEPEARGYFALSVDGVLPGQRYRYRLDGPGLADGQGDYPDPASLWQPEGVHGPSAVLDSAAHPFAVDSWEAPSTEESVIYELHVGAFTPEGTFAAIIPRLDALRELGVNTVEIMPVGRFPGTRNWGYDGAFPFAAQDSYGGAAGLKSLADACHARDMALVVDVVYNHLGPEGNWLDRYGPYFTDHYRTPWGRAVNFDQAGSDEVRLYFLEHARYLLEVCRVDGLRLDALHAVHDQSAEPFLAELAAMVEDLSARLGRRLMLWAESDLNDPRLIRPRHLGGLGLHSQWNDDFHHALHALLTDERGGYYRDFGAVGDLAKAYAEGYVYDGRYSAHRGRRHGSSAVDRSGCQFVAYSQNHDQVGNRMLGERLAQLTTFESQKLAAAALLLSPFVPLLFMGQEYGEPAPFLYFISHENPDLVAAVREGRARDFAAFAHRGAPPDPQSEATFAKSRIDWSLRDVGHHKVLLELHRELLTLRRTVPALRRLWLQGVSATALEAERLLVIGRRFRDSLAFFWLHFGREPLSFTPAPEALDGLCGEARRPHQGWRLALDTADARWDGPGSTLPPVLRLGEAITAPPLSAALYLCRGG